MSENPDAILTDEAAHKLRSRFNGAVRRAQAAIFWERLWPKAVTTLSAGGLFLSTSWFGLWGAAPPAARMAGTLGFAAAFLAAPFLTRTGSLHVTRKEAVQRLDRNAGDDQHPARTLDDQLAAGNAAEAEKIWDLHVKDVLRQWGGRFRAGMPRPDVNRFDAFRLRYAVLACTLISAALAGEQRWPRLAEAFNWNAPPEPVPVIVKAPLRLKAVVTPPDNINVKPLSLTEETNDDRTGGKKLVAHQNSILTILTIGESPAIMLNGEAVPVKRTISDGKGGTNYEYAVQLDRHDSFVSIADGPQWHFEVTPDLAPEVDLKAIRPVEKMPGALEVFYVPKDDQGVMGGEIRIITPKSRPEAKPLPGVRLPVIAVP